MQGLLNNLIVFVKKIYLLVFFVFNIISIFAQGRIGGTVTNNLKLPMSGVVVKIVGTRFQTQTNTDANGSFIFSNINSGTYMIVIKESEYFEFTEEIEYIKGEDYRINDIVLEKINASKDITIELPTSAVFDDESNNNSSGNDISSLLNASRDIFLSAASFNLSQGGYRVRGYDNFQDLVMVNGVPMQNLFRGGDVAYGDFGGLNDVLRSRNTYFGIKAIPFSFGQMASTVDIDAEALNQRKGMRLSYMNTNRNFRNRLMGTYNSGMLKNGFSFSVSGSFRGAEEGYVPGTAFESFAGFFSVSKIWSPKLNTTLTAFASKNKRAVQGSSIQEFMDLAKTNYYNPSWGWQDGHKRSANLRNDFIPNIILSNEWKPNHSTTLNFSVGYQFGEHKRIGLDWYNSYNPNPTYYRKAPSFYKDDIILRDQLIQDYTNNPEKLQIDWDALYNANYTSRELIPGSLTDSGRWARYMMSSQTEKLSNLTANVILNKKINESIELHAGVLFQNSLNEQFREIEDLMGADFFVNINQFAERADPTNPSAKQNDLNNPNKIVKEGDIYGYHFLGRVTKMSSFLQWLFSVDRTDFYITGNIEHTAMQRSGYMRNGAFANNSYGNSKEVSIWNFGVKSGFTYKFDGRNYIGAQALHMSRPQEFNQIFVLQRTTNTVSDNLSSPTITSLELNYNHRGPRFKFSSNVFITETKNESSQQTFYTELTNSFGSLIMSNINKRFLGIEMSADVQLGGGFSATFAGALNDNEFILRPKVDFYYDNLDRREPTETVYFHGLHVANGPQTVGMARLNYNSKQFWSASVSLNYFGDNYVEPSPQRRSTEGIDNVPINSDLYYRIIKQEKTNNAFTLDASFRKSIYLNKYIKSLKKRLYLDINLSANNILNVTDYARNGREQLRFDFRERDPDKYPNRYFYMLGRNYAAIITLRF